MADTITFSGSTAYLAPTFIEPRLIPQYSVIHIPRSYKARTINNGSAGEPVTLNLWITESTTADALATIDTWQALEGTQATLSWAIDGGSDSTDNVLLLRVEKTSRSGDTIAFSATFIKVDE